MGEGKGRKILCPVPLVVDLEEPPVVPDFMKELTTRGWTPVQLNTYLTRWMGKDCARELLNHDIAAVIFTSTAEVEGLCKSMNYFQELSGDWKKRKNRTFLVATHGPVTARGPDRLGVEVDVVGEKYDSFSRIVDQVCHRNWLSNLISTYEMQCELLALPLVLISDLLLHWQGHT